MKQKELNKFQNEILEVDGDTMSNILCNYKHVKDILAIYAFYKYYRSSLNVECQKDSIDTKTILTYLKVSKKRVKYVNNILLNLGLFETKNT